MSKKTIQRLWAIVKIQSAQNNLKKVDAQSKKAWNDFLSKNEKPNVKTLIAVEKNVEIAEENYNKMRRMLCLEY
jgi:hypothetical protein